MLKLGGGYLGFVILSSLLFYMFEISLIKFVFVVFKGDNEEVKMGEVGERVHIDNFP